MTRKRPGGLGTAVAFAVLGMLAPVLVTASPVASAAVDPVPACTPPAPTVVGGGRSSLTVAVTPCTAETGVVGYRITAHEAGATDASAVADRPRLVGNQPLGPVTFTGLPAGRAYRFTVAALGTEGAGPTSALSAPAPLPLTSPSSFTSRQYLDLAGRPATAAEQSDWAARLGTGALTPVGAVNALQSAPYWQHQSPVVRLFRAYFLRLPDLGGLAYWTGQRRAGTGLNTISSKFAGSKEFRDRYGSLSNRAFVERVYQNVLGRPGEPTGIAFWAKELDTHRRSRGQVMVGFSESPEYRSATARTVTTVNLFTGLLRRVPTPSEISEWAGRGTGALIIGLLGSQAYAARTGTGTTGFCPALPGVDTWIFDGEDPVDPTRWGMPKNWNHPGVGPGFGNDAEVPGERNDPDDKDDYVCIPTGFDVELREGASAHLVAMDSRADDLRVLVGAKLQLKGKVTVGGSTAPTYASTTDDIDINGLLYGEGLVTVRPGATMTWHGGPGLCPNPGDPCAASMSTREDNELLPNAALPATHTPGRTVIAPGASLLIDDKGVNLFDGRVIENRGTTTVLGNSTFVAADRGSTLDNLGTLVFQGDGDFVQGFLRGLSARASLINHGLLTKSAGSGTSVIDANYSAPGGTATVSSGTLSILATGVVIGVQPGAAAADGGCSTTNLECPDAGTTGADPQWSGLGLPATSVAVPVVITERPDLAGPGVVGNPVDITATGETADALNPLTLRLAVDGSVVVPLTRDSQTLNVTHDASGNLPNCPSLGQCVDRAASLAASAALTGGDVVLVIRSADNGRWKLRL